MGQFTFVDLGAPFMRPPGFPGDEYFAGFFDGEGHVSIAVTPQRAYANPNLLIDAGVSNKNIGIMELFAARWGGGRARGIVTCRNKRGQGGATVTRCKESSFVGGIVYQWRATGSRAAQFLRDIRPYLRVKGPEADIGLEFFEFRERHRLGQGYHGQKVLPAAVLEEGRAFVARIRAARAARDGGNGRWAR